MEIPFPTSSSSWTAPDPFQWSIALRESLSIPTPSFRNALRELAGRGQIPNGLNDQSLWILIHGLINVSWTLLWRDLGELSMVHENKITGWKDSLRRAFRIWVGHVEGRVAGSRCEEALYTVGIPFAQLGSILLLSDTEMIRIFAGAANIAGRTISPGEWTAANTYVHAWAKSQDGAYACYTAIELLSQVYKWSAEDRWSTAPAFIPWCAYISSLIIWAYSTVLDGPDSLQAPYIIPSTTRTLLEHGQTSEIRIEPSLARRAAQTYLADMLRRTAGEVFALPDVKGKNACAGVLAYTAYLVGIGGRGVLEEARRVLLGLLGEG